MALHLVAYSGLFGSTTIVTESPKKVNVNHKLGQVSEVVVIFFVFWFFAKKKEKLVFLRTKNKKKQKKFQHFYSY